MDKPNHLSPLCLDVCTIGSMKVSGMLGKNKTTPTPCVFQLSGSVRGGVNLCDNITRRKSSLMILMARAEEVLSQSPCVLGKDPPYSYQGIRLWAGIL